MKTRILIIIGIAVPIAGIIIGLSFLTLEDLTHYVIEIQGMKDTYNVGEKYSFYYTESGYGNTCEGWVVAFPDKNGTIQKRGMAIDCTKPTNKNFVYDSRKENRMFSSVVPDIPGKYNVTVSTEHAGLVMHEFTVHSEKTDMCYGVFNCDPSKSTFSSCINGKINGESIKDICSNPDIEINDGCITLTFPDHGLTQCEQK